MYNVNTAVRACEYTNSYLCIMSVQDIGLVSRTVHKSLLCSRDADIVSGLSSGQPTDAQSSGVGVNLAPKVPVSGAPVVSTLVPVSPVAGAAAAGASAAGAPPLVLQPLVPPPLVLPPLLP